MGREGEYVCREGEEVRVRRGEGKERSGGWEEEGVRVRGKRR